MSHHQGMELTRAKSRAQIGMSVGSTGAQGVLGMQGSPSISRRMPHLTADPEDFLKDVKSSKGERGQRRQVSARSLLPAATGGRCKVCNSAPCTCHGTCCPDCNGGAA